MQEVMGQMDIAFPNLKIYLENVPKNFTIFNFTIAWYGVIIAFGMALALLFCGKEAKRYGMKSDVIYDFALYGIVAAIIGARAYYVICDWETYKDNFWSIFHIRGGGLAIYGGVIGGFLAAFIYTKIKKIRFTQLVDIASFGLLIGQVIGRFANFMNREAFGGYTNSLLAMRLPLEMVRQSDVTQEMMEHVTGNINYVQVHPTFLYESAWNTVLFVLLFLFRKHKLYDGQITLYYLGCYGLGRFFIERLRTDQLFIPGTSLPISMVLGAVLFGTCLIVDVYMRIRLLKKKPINESPK